MTWVFDIQVSLFINATRTHRAARPLRF